MNDMVASIGGLTSWLENRVSLPGSGLAWLDKERADALNSARTLGLPTRKDEGWRYTSVQSLAEQTFVRPTNERPLANAIDLPYLVDGLDAHRVVFVDGRYAPRLSDLAGLPRGVRAASFQEMIEADPDAIEGRLNRIAASGSHIFSALNTAAFDDGLVLLIESGGRLERPLEIVHIATGSEVPEVYQPRHLVVLGEEAQATVVERYLGGPGPYCANALVELSLARAATLTHQRFQMEGESAYHLSGLYLEQGESSVYRGVNIGLGGQWARTDLISRFAGEHADCEFLGLYLAGDGQVMDYHLDVNHTLPNCASRENFKGILYGKGRAVFNGRVFVAVDAQKTDAHLSNKNLMLSRSAEIDTKPQLEINADDVKCSHGTTVGQIEPEMLFYLRSRGIAAPAARRMLCLGFAQEIIGAIDSEPLRQHIGELVGERLEQAPAE